MEFVAADSGIRQLYARCVDAVWRKDTASFSECYVDDGEWEVAGFHFHGRHQIAKGLGQLLDANERVLMMMGHPVLEIMDDTALGRTPVYELVKTKRGAGCSTIGTYYEKFVNQSGVWLFRSRRFEMNYFGPIDLSIPLLSDTERH